MDIIPSIVSFVTGALVAIFAEPIRCKIYEPCIELSFDKQEPPFVTKTKTNDRKDTTYVKVKVSNTKGFVKNCIGYLTDIKKFNEQSKKWKNTSFYVDFLPLFWSGLRCEKMNLPKGSVFFLDLFSIRDKSHIQLETMVVLNRHEDIVADPGKYLFTIKVCSENAKTKEIKLKLEWTNCWNTSKISCISY